MLFQGLNFMEGSGCGITLQKKFRTIVMKHHSHNANDKFCRHYESKPGLLHGQIESKMAQNRGISAAHTCTTYYRQCLPRGAIDCTHIQIPSPGGLDAELNRNRKGYFSIKVHAVCGPNLKILNVVARWPGSVHDARIFDNNQKKSEKKSEKYCLPVHAVCDMM